MSDWRWLTSTRELQETAYGVDFSKRQEGAELADNLVHQGFALIIELAECFGEIQWKDWAKDRGQHDRDAAVGELVDVAHFLANLLVHFGVTDEEWEQLYQAKQERNRQRQASAGGYDAKKSKCPNPACKRELDKPGATRWNGNALVCYSCGAYLAAKVMSNIAWEPTVDGNLVHVP